MILVSSCYNNFRKKTNYSYSIAIEILSHCAVFIFASLCTICAYSRTLFAFITITYLRRAGASWYFPSIKFLPYVPKVFFQIRQMILFPVVHQRGCVTSGKECLQFAGHCYWADKEMISSLILWCPVGRVQSRKLTYPEVTTGDSGLDMRDLSVTMVNRGLGGDLYECPICSSGQRMRRMMMKNQ